MALPPSATELMHQPSISLSAAHDRVVCVLAQLYGLRYCPMLSNLGLLLLRHLSESLTFSVLETLLKDNREEWFQKTWEDEVAFVNTFQDVLESRHPKLATHLESLGGGTFSFYGSWFRSFFVGWITSEVRSTAVMGVPFQRLALTTLTSGAPLLCCAAVPAGYVQDRGLLPQ